MCKYLFKACYRHSHYGDVLPAPQKFVQGTWPWQRKKENPAEAVEVKKEFLQDEKVPHFPKLFEWSVHKRIKLFIAARAARGRNFKTLRNLLFLCVMTFHLLSSRNAYLYLFKGIFNIVLKSLVHFPFHPYMHTYSGTTLYGHPLIMDSFVCPDKKLIHFI